jgi:hypothetical protein
VTIKDRLDTLEASHVALMTDFELFVKEHEKRVAEQDARWERFETDRVAAYRREQERGAAIDQRIGDLVTAIGKLIETKKP